jgi:hypothetical protein
VIDFSKGVSSDYPYPHMIIEECFNEDTFEKLVLEFPKIYSDTEFGGRKKMPLDHPNFDTWIMTAPTWREFYEIMSGNDIFSTFMNYYKDYIEHWYGNVSVDSEVGKDCFLDMDWSVAGDGYVREVHKDMPKRILNFLIFFSDKDWDGGDFLIHTSDDMIELPRQIWKELPVHDIIEAKKNRGIFFLSTPDSYHSVSKQSNTKSDRKFIYGAYSLFTGGAFGRQKK